METGAKRRYNLADTRTPEELQNEAVIQEMLRGAQPAEIPSELRSNPIVHKGDGNQPAPMVVTSIKDGYVWVWDSRTGEQIPVIYYMLAQQLRKRRPDGSFRFTTIDPKVAVKHGTIKCLFHEADPNRGRYDELGFPTCQKSNITNPFQLRRHMQTKHKEEWKALEQEREERERQEERELRKLMLQRSLGEATQTAIMTAVKPKSELICPKCGADFTNRVAWTKHTQECQG